MFRFNSNCVFLCFLLFFFFSCSFFFQLKLNTIEFWTKSTLISNLVLNSIYSMFDLSFLLPLFPFLVPSFLLLFFQLSFLFYVPLSFPFLIVKVFQFSDNLSDNLAITFCWKRDPGGGIDSFDPKKKKGSTKKWTGSRHQATTLYSDLGSLMHFFIATNASFLEPLVYINMVFLVRRWDRNRFPCLGKSLGMCLDSSPTWLQTQRQRKALNPSPAV